MHACRCLALPAKIRGAQCAPPRHSGSARRVGWGGAAPRWPHSVPTKAHAQRIVQRCPKVSATEQPNQNTFPNASAAAHTSAAQSHWSVPMPPRRAAPRSPRASVTATAHRAPVHRTLAMIACKGGDWLCDLVQLSLPGRARAHGCLQGRVMYRKRTRPARRGEKGRGVNTTRGDVSKHASRRPEQNCYADFCMRLSSP